MTTSRQNLGRWGETQATIYLETRGYKILERNVHTSYGEIDIIAQKDEVAIFVEVKTRRSYTYGYPEESITPIKQEHMVNASQAYLVEHPELGNNWQIDVISIQHNQQKTPEIIHFENAITG